MKRSDRLTGSDRARFAPTEDARTEAGAAGKRAAGAKAAETNAAGAGAAEKGAEAAGISTGGTNRAGTYTAGTYTDGACTDGACTVGACTDGACTDGTNAAGPGSAGTAEIDRRGRVAAGTAWALVTGAGTGIGRCFALRLAALGYNLVIVGMNRSALEAVRREILAAAGAQKASRGVSAGSGDSDGAQISVRDKRVCGKAAAVDVQQAEAGTRISDADRQGSGMTRAADPNDSADPETAGGSKAPADPNATAGTEATANPTAAAAPEVTADAGPAAGPRPVDPKRYAGTRIADGTVSGCPPISGAESARGREVRIVVIDLARAEASDELYAAVRGLGVEIDVLINNAGIFSFRDLLGTPPERIERMILLHDMTLTKNCLAFGRDMAARGRGWILNMSSYSIWMPFPGMALYTATKAYVRSFSVAFAKEVREQGVRVTAVCPAGVATDLYGLTPRWQRIGLRIGVLISADSCARRGLQAMWRGRRTIVPDWWNRAWIPLCKAMPMTLLRPLRRFTMRFQK